MKSGFTKHIAINLTPKFYRQFLLFTAIVLTLTSVLTFPVQAATIEVDTTTDVSDGSCADGDCSLRDAIATAAAGDTITFNASLNGQTIALTLGQISISKNLTITGPGASQLTISGNNTSRIFNIPNGSTNTLSISGLTLANGSAGDGAGIRWDSSGTLTLTDVTMSGNNAGFEGGAIYQRDGDVEINESTFSNNASTNFAGGALLISSDAGADSTTIDKSTFSNNSADDSGGAIDSSATLTVTNSTFDNNEAGDDGGSGGAINSSANLTVTNSTFSNNTAGANGGAIASFSFGGAEVNITNSTISGNSAKGHGGGISFGETFNESSLNNVTIYNNTADSDDNGSGDGGGFYEEGPPADLFKSILAKNSIIAGNTDKGGEMPDCGGSDATGDGYINSGDYNLIQDTTGCTISGTTTNNITGQDPNLGALANNGGDTQTHELNVGSPAIDKGNSAGCTDHNSAALTTDQRGETRPINVRCDIGAFEVSFSDLEVAKDDNTGGSGTVNTAFNWTVTISNTGTKDATFTSGQTIFKDDLPASGANYGTATAQNFTDITNSANIDCNISGTTLTCTANSAAVTIGASNGKFDVVFSVTPTAAGTLANPDASGTCKVDPDGNVTEDDETNNTCSDSVTVLNYPTFEKAFSDSTISVGETSTLTFTITNSNSSGLTGLNFTDTYPSDVVNTTPLNVGGTCGSITHSATDGGNTFNLTGATIGASTTCTVTTTVTASSAGSKDNTAQNIGSTETGSGTDDATATLTVYIPVIDLELVKSVDDDTPDVGDTVTFTLKVDNKNSDNATGVEVVDQIPDGYENISAISNSGVYDSVNNTITWSGLSINGNSSTSLTFSADVKSSGNYENYAQVNAADQGDADSSPGNGQQTPDEDDDDTQSVVPTSADLSVDKSVNNVNPNVGDTVSFTIILKNDGPDTASNIQVTDVVPTGYAYSAGAGNISSDAGTTGATITTDESSAPTLIWTIDELDNGESVTLSFDADVQSTGDHTNLAQITASDQQDPDSDPAVDETTDDKGDGLDDDDEDTATANPNAADLSLMKVVSNSAASAGDNVTFTITVKNRGPIDATGVKVADLLPNGYLYVSDNPSQGTYDDSSGEWIIGNIPLNGEVSLEIVATVQASGTYKNVAQVSASDIYDPDSTPNNDDGDQSEDDEASATLGTTHINAAPTGLKEVDAQGWPDVVWRMIWINAANAGALDVRVEDHIPINATYVASSLNCDPQGTSTTTTCQYDASTDQIVWVGNISADLGATDEASANHEVIITYTTTVAANINAVENQGQAFWDENNDTNLDHDDANIANNNPVLTNNPSASFDGVIPTVATQPGDGDDDTDGGSFYVGRHGGTFVACGDWKIIIPPGVVPDNSLGEIQCKVGPLGPAIGSGFIALDQLVEITITGPDGELITTFTPNIQVCYDYKEADVDAAGGNAYNLIMVSYTEGASGWEFHAIFLSDGWVCAHIGHLSLFEILVASNLPATGFTPGVVTDLQVQPVPKEYFGLNIFPETLEFPGKSEANGDFRLEIPTLGLDLPIVGVPLSESGWDVTWLGDSAGYLEGTAYPTWEGNTAITAHVWNANNQPGPFIDLHTLQHGDQILIHAWEQKHVYEVRALTEVRPDDLSALPHSEFDMLTLLTCKGFDETSGAYAWRLAVQAVLVDIR